MELLELESFTRDEMDNLRNRFTVKRARGFSTSKKVRATWYVYQDERKKMEKELFKPLSVWVDDAITAAAGNGAIELDRRRRATKAIQDARSVVCEPRVPRGIGPLIEQGNL